MGLKSMENRLSKLYLSLNENSDKFSYLEVLFSDNILLSQEDYKRILADNDEIIYFFIDEYSFSELPEDGNKLDLIRKFLDDKINKVDDYIFSDLLDFASRIKYWDVLRKITLNGKSITRQTLVLNFIENGKIKIDKNYLSIFLKAMLQLELEPLNKFIVLFNLSLIDNSYLNQVNKMKLLGDSKIQARIKMNEKFYN